MSFSPWSSYPHWKGKRCPAKQELDQRPYIGLRYKHIQIMGSLILQQAENGSTQAEYRAENPFFQMKCTAWITLLRKDKRFSQRRYMTTENGCWQLKINTIESPTIFFARINSVLNQQWLNKNRTRRRREQAHDDRPDDECNWQAKQIL